MFPTRPGIFVPGTGQQEMTDAGANCGGIGVVVNGDYAYTTQVFSPPKGIAMRPPE
jgi:hypothetical protein